MKNVILALLFLGMAVSSWSQKYVTAVGMRLGTDWGLTLQQRLTKGITLEGIAQSSLQREEIMVTGLLEKHLPFLGRRLNIYLGGGVHKGWNTSGEFRQDGSPVVEDPFGVTLVGGIEFTVGRINVGYDLKPAFNIRGGEKRFYSQSGLSLRYVLLKEKDLRKIKRKKRKKRRRRKRR